MDHLKAVVEGSPSGLAGIRSATARWRHREADLVEGNPVLRRFVNPPRSLFALVIALAVAFRVVSLFAIPPGNAPDEAGHMVCSLALSQPELLTLDKEHNYSWYHYSAYNPAPYLPSAVLLGAGGLFDASLNRMSIPMRISDRSTYVARAGMLAWAAIFLVYLAKSARLNLGDDAWLAVGLCGLVPQLTFVQTYVNMDSMGVAAFALLVWSLSIRSLPLVAVSVVLVANSKLNYLAILSLPFIFFAYWYLPKVGELARKTLLYLGLPILVALPWYVWNYYTNTRQYGDLLGVNSYGKIYGDVPGGMRVFTKDFLTTSLGSAFGYFGYMNQFLPRPYYWFWSRILLVGTASLFACLLSPRAEGRWRVWHLGLATVFVGNVALHFWASYAKWYQPQGRYLFPAILIALAYYVVALGWIARNVSLLFGQALKYASLLFFLVSAWQGIAISGTDPDYFGFRNGLRPILAQDDAREEVAGFTKGSYLRQTFTPGDAVLRFVEFPVSMKRRGRMDEMLYVAILDDQGKVLARHEKSTSLYAREAPIIFSVGQLEVEAGKTYSLLVRGIGAWSRKASVTFHRSNTDAYRGGALFLEPDGDATPYDLTFRVY